MCATHRRIKRAQQWRKRNNATQGIRGDACLHDNAGGHARALAQTKVTNPGHPTPTEIVIGTHQDLSGPIKTWGVPVANGMKLAVEEINAAGGINGRKLKLILEDSAYDPKKAVLASQKMIEKDKVFAMIGGMGTQRP